MKEVIIASIALGITGFCFALLLSFLNRKLKVEEDPRVSQIVSLLPGANCGACGFAGCRGFAQAVINEGKIFQGCIPGGKEVNDKITQILGVEASSSHKQIAICRCGADFSEKKTSSLYRGPKSCKAADITAGAIDCTYGCLGFGDCIESCPAKAITLDNGRIKINNKKCIGCGQCLKVCPRSLFKIIPWQNDTNLYWVACNNKEKAPGVKLVCGRGCISCGICAKVSNSPYSLQDNLSSVDYKKKYDSAALEEGKNKCPTKCIFTENV